MSARPADRGHGPALAGLVPFTTVDYPDGLACVAFLGGCPWRCGYCHNPHLQQATAIINWSDFADWLDERRGLLDAVVFSGGEPTLAPHLPAAMAAVRELGFRIGLHSAGVSPRHLATVLPWCDWLGLDIKAPAARYAAVTGARGSARAAEASLELALAAGVNLEVRTTYAPTLFPLPELLQMADRLARRGVRSFALQGLRTTHAQPTWDGPSAEVLATLRRMFSRVIWRQ